MNQRLLPTFACFDDVAGFVAERLQEDRSLLCDQRLIIVHGIALGTNGPREGEPYAHAWCEEDGLCWDAGMLDGVRVFYAVQADEYYAVRRIRSATGYTILAAAAEEQRTGGCGPWEPTYRALVGKGDRRIFGELQVIGPAAGCA